MSATVGSLPAWCARGQRARDRNTAKKPRNLRRFIAAPEGSGQDFWRVSLAHLGGTGVVLVRAV